MLSQSLVYATFWGVFWSNHKYHQPSATVVTVNDIVYPTSFTTLHNQSLVDWTIVIAASVSLQTFAGRLQTYLFELP